MPLANLAGRLAEAIGPERVLTEVDALVEYRGIAWGPPTAKVPLRWPIGRAAAAVRPASTEDVLAAVAIARAAHAPIVPYGAGTGVHAGATPLEGAILVDLGAMQEVLEISAIDRVARVQPGVILGDLDRLAGQQGLMVGHDPWSQPIASVGGATSTNGVGYLAGKYGPMGEQVVGMQVVLATGEVLEVPAIPKASTGPQLRHFFIGAEGTLGLITRVDLRLFPIPEVRQLRGYWFACFEDGLGAVQDMQAIGLRPAMVDYEEDTRTKPPLGELPPTPSEMYLAFEGFREEVAAQVARAEAISTGRGGEPMTAEAAQEFWDTRHQSAERYVEQKAQGSPWSTRRWAASHVNIGLPTSAIQTFRQRAAELLVPHRMVVTGSGLWAMPELFSVRFEHVEPEDPGAFADVDAGTDAGLRLAQELGGSMEYCHGVGLRLAHLMADELGPGLDALRRVKRALDPDGLLNPGKLDL